MAWEFLLHKVIGTSFKTVHIILAQYTKRYCKNFCCGPFEAKYHERHNTVCLFKPLKRTTSTVVLFFIRAPTPLPHPPGHNTKQETNFSLINLFPRKGLINKNTFWICDSFSVNYLMKYEYMIVPLAGKLINSNNASRQNLHQEPMQKQTKDASRQ